MKNKLQNEEGYSLLIALLIVLLFAILGAGLMAMSFSGVTRNETRENIVQSNDLATMGMTHITTEITYRLDDLILNERMTAEKFLTEFDRILKEYHCGTGSLSKKASENAGTEYKVCIDKVEDDLESLVQIGSQQKALRKNITFKSIGESGGSENAIYSTYNLGATQYPEVLNYAVGAYKYQGSDTKRFPQLPGEGDLYLNGGVNIIGDFKVDNNLYVSKTGLWLSGDSGVSEVSVFPQVQGSITNPEDRSKLFLAGDLYKFNTPHSLKTRWNDNVFSYQQYINNPISNSNYLKHFEKYSQSNLQEIFLNNNAPQLIKEFVEIVPIDFVSKNSAMSFNRTTANQHSVETIPENSTKNSFTLNGQKKNQDTYLGHTRTERGKCNSWFILICIGWSPQYVFETDGNYTLTGDIEIGTRGIRNSGRFRTEGNLVLNNSDTKFYNGAHIAKNLVITNDTTISGLVYVKGDLSINNSSLTSDAIFFVEGEVKIDKSTIKGIEKDDGEGSLIIFAQGNIQLSNNSEYDKNPSEFKAYLYSEKTLTIFGVGSNIKIKGGISARKIILNAVRGDTKQEIKRECNWWGSQCKDVITGGLAVDNENIQKNKTSRLQIEYDEEIIKNYSELDIVTEPWIDNISPPIELERSYEPG